MERPIYMVIIMLGIVLAILGSSLFYVGRKLFKWLCVIQPNVNPKLYLIIPAVIALSFVLGFLPISPVIKKYFVWFNFCFIGVVLYFLLLFALSDVVLLVGKLTKIVPSPVPHNFTIIIGWIVIALVTGITAYGIYNGKQLKQVSYNVEIEKNTSLEKLNIALIADTHLGHLNNEKWLSKIVDQINSLEPDIVVIAGDIFNDNFHAVQKPEESIRTLQNIKSKYGVYACMGNHDAGNTFNEMLRFLEQGNVKVLQDEFVIIEDKFILLGRSDPSPIGGVAPPRKETVDVLIEIASKMDIYSLPIIVIDHNPANLKEYDNKVDLLLAGHTHKGQVFPGNLVTNRIYEVDYGYYQRDKNSPHVVVTSGAGLWGPPLRIGSNNEVVNIHINRVD